MGMYDIVWVKCPKCSEPYEAQSKSGDCTLDEYELENAPDEVVANVNRHAPFQCYKCGTWFMVKLFISREVITVNRPDE